MITLHHSPGTASMTPHAVLRELGLPFELVPVDRAANAHKSPAYLALNPNGLIPVLVDGDLVLHETAAIALHLADSHPQAALAPPPVPGSAERARFMKWMFWLSNSLQAAMPLYFYSHRYVEPGNAAGAAEVKAQAEIRIAGLVDQIEAELARHGGPWLTGADYTVADPYVFMLCRWTRNMQRPARTLPRLAAYLPRVLQRPAMQQVFEVEGLGQPFF